MLQKVMSDARADEEEYLSRPSGDSPREYATTPRYFSSSGEAAGNGQNGHTNGFHSP